MVLHVVNGPNLNLVGRREPDIYGARPLDGYLDELAAGLAAAGDGVTLERFQSNHEGELVDYLQSVGFRQNTGVILNAGALGHTSLALGDCVRAIRVPVVDVHISNVYAREAFRQNSYVAPAAAGTIAGFGLAGYRLAAEWLAGELARRAAAGATG